MSDGPHQKDSRKSSVVRRDLVRGAGAAAALAGLTAVSKASAGGGHGHGHGGGHGHGHGRTKKFIRDVTSARIFDLTHVWDENSPIAGVNPPYSSSLNATHANTQGTFGDGGQLSFASEIQQWSGQHGAPSIDAIGHIGHNGLLFGGVNAAAATSDPRGIGYSGVGAELGIDAYPVEKIVNRGVLLDVARLIMGDQSPLPADFEITAQHLQDAADAAHLEVEGGDIVLIRTGWGQYFSSDPNFYKGDFSAGLGVDAGAQLVDWGVFAAGNDTLTFEKRPPITFDPQFQVFPVHMQLIADNGIHIIENYLLEPLSEAEVYEFLLVTAPLKHKGGTASALRAFAMAP